MAVNRMLRNLAVAAAAAAVVTVPLAAATALPSNGTQPKATISDVRTTPGHVQFDVTVTGLPAGQQLDPSSLVVTVGGRALPASAGAAQVVTAPDAGVVREVVLTLDTSGSMAGAGITAARTAAMTYAAKLPADVKIGLVTFSDVPRILLQPTRDRAALDSALAKVQAGGNTSLYDAVSAAAALLKNLPASAERRLLVLSDGDDTTSSRTLADAVAALTSAKVKADVVAFRLPGDRAALDRIASTSGGTVISASDAGSLAGAFAQAASAFGQRARVTVTVPADVPSGEQSLTVSLNAGAQSITAATTAALTPAPTVSALRPTTVPGSITSGTGLWLTLAAAFLGFLAVALGFLFVPVLRNERASWQARVAEASRYRVVENVGQAGGRSATAVADSEGEVARKTLATVDRALRARGQREKLQSEIEQAGLRMRPEEWAVLQLAAVLAVAAIFFVLGRGIVFIVLGGLAGWLGCRVFVRIRIDRRSKAFSEQLPDNLQLLAGSLRSGFSLAQALGTVVNEGIEPTASEFTRALTEVRLGSELEDALDRVADRVDCKDLHWVVMAIRISREVGGNLAEVLDNTIETMRERARLRGTVRVLSAEGRLSARILTALPIFIALFFILVRPTYVHPLFHERTGIIMLAVGIIELGVGIFWLSRLTKIEV